jgi:peptidoglycan/LPS O-acetylase OafA/YrhL
VCDKKSNLHASVRLDIQGLRAIAVLAVLGFHLWPAKFSGGYVGVDVFFVISGYLITGLLLREIDRTGKLSLVNFYRRRIRRLLPAATVVIVVSCSFFWLLPWVQWKDIAWDAIASAIYIQNWSLAARAIDYLTQERPPGLLQHYWSLSVEEQFYAIWPVIVWFFVQWSSSITSKKFKSFLLITIFIIGFVSLAYSVYLTRSNSGLAYFATTTRVWELALGAMLAVSGSLRVGGISEPLRNLCGCLGLGMIVAGVFLYDTNTSFPGWAALLPTVGTALLIFQGSTSNASFLYNLLSIRPLCFLGDVSYSLYLWHWPVLLLYKAYWQVDRVSWLQGLEIAVISCFFAYLTKIWVEDPIRYNRPIWKRTAVPSTVILATSILMAILPSSLIMIYGVKGEKEEIATPDMLMENYNPELSIIPSLEQARNDNPPVYQLGCHVNQTSSEPKSCEFGSNVATKIIALVGDSHAAQWLPMLLGVYDDRSDWRVVTFTKSACPFNAQPISIANIQGPYEACKLWNENVLDALRNLMPKIVVVSQSSTYKAYGIPDPENNANYLADGLLVRWRQILDLGAKLVVIRDTPHMNKDVPACLSTRGMDEASCSTPKSQALKLDPTVLAIEKKPAGWRGINYMDLTETMCGPLLCGPIKGRILIYRDSHHLTATFSKLLAKQVNSLGIFAD